MMMMMMMINNAADYDFNQVVVEHMDQMISGEDFERTIQNFHYNFSRYLLELLDKLSHYSTMDCEHQMLNIIARLDHNGFYTSELERRASLSASTGPGSAGEGTFLPFCHST